jgi:hypothetical protein
MEITNDNFNAIVLIGESKNGLTYMYLSHDMKDDKHGVINHDPLTIEAEYEIGFPDAKGIYRANVNYDYSYEQGVRTTINTYELIHDLKL